MLRRYIESRERRQHQRDTERKSLPFGWGLDNLGLSADGHPEAHMQRFVSECLDDSETFFSCPPTSAYVLDGSVLRFPSALASPYAVNNTVWARVFEAGGDLAVIVLPQWNSKWNSHVTLCRLLQMFGITSLRLSLPYHDRRKPRHLKRPEYLVAPNIGLTLAANRQAVLDSRRAADWLALKGYRRLAILGTSIGSSVAFLTYTHDRRFTAGVFIHVSSFFADVVWRGMSTKHVRASLESSIDLEQLRFFWSPISPFPFIKRLRGATQRTLILSGSYDLTFLPELAQTAFEEFDRNRIPYELARLPCGHYTMGRFPFNVYAGYRIVQFLKAVQFRDDDGAAG